MKPSSVPATAFSRSPAFGSLRQPRREQAQARVCAAPDAAAQLMQLADAEPVGVHHEHHGRIGNVDTDLDDGGAHQNVDLAGPERGHHGVLLVAGQPAVHQTETQPGQRTVTQVFNSFSTVVAGGPLSSLAGLSFSSMRDATT